MPRGKGGSVPAVTLRCGHLTRVRRGGDIGGALGAGDPRTTLCTAPSGAHLAPTVHAPWESPLSLV